MKKSFIQTEINKINSLRQNIFSRQNFEKYLSKNKIFNKTQKNIFFNETYKNIFPKDIFKNIFFA